MNFETEKQQTKLVKQKTGSLTKITSFNKSLNTSIRNKRGEISLQYLHKRIILESLSWDIMNKPTHMNLTT